MFAVGPLGTVVKSPIEGGDVDGSVLAYGRNLSAIVGHHLKNANVDLGLEVC